MAAGRAVSVLNPDVDAVLITRDPLSLDAAVKAIACEPSPLRSEDDAVGAIVTFAGTVRAQEGDRRIDSLSYDHYEGMAQAESRKLIAQARERWPLRRIAIHHRVGAVGVGESSVIVAVAAGHRAEAFAAARFLIDELKRSVPIWKQAPGP